MAEKNQRIRLLSEYEINAIYSLPNFTDPERSHYFQLDEIEYTILKGMHSSARIYFILQLGYFRAKHLLFNFTFHSIKADFNHVISRFFPEMKRPKALPSRNRITLVNQKILILLEFREPSKKTNKLIQKKLAKSIQQINDPIYVFRDLITAMEKEKITLPSYSTLQDWISNAMTTEEARLMSAVKKHFTQKITALIDRLFTTNNAQSFYDLTLLKQKPKNFNHKMIATEVKKHKKYYILYRFAKRFLPKLDLSTQNVVYYGSMVEHYQIQALKRFPNEKRYFYLICYVYHRFQQMNDQLIETLFHYVDNYNKEARQHSKDRASEINTSVKKTHGAAAKTLLYWYRDKTLSKKVFGQIQKDSANILSDDNIVLVGEFLSNDDVDKKRYEWEFHDKNFQCLIKMLDPLSKR